VVESFVLGVVQYFDNLAVGSILVDDIVVVVGVVGVVGVVAVIVDYMAQGLEYVFVEGISVLFAVVKGGIELDGRGNRILLLVVGVVGCLAMLGNRILA
jgi:hypothetical protein